MNILVLCNLYLLYLYLINEGISYIFNFFQPYLFDFIRLLIGGELDYLHILCNRAVVACYLRRYFIAY